MSLRFVITVVVATLAVVAGAAAAASSVLDTAPQGTPSSVPPPERPVVSRVPRAQAGSFSILRRPRTPADALGVQAVASIRRHGLGGNPALARRALVTDTGLALYVVPGNGTICLYNQTASGACTGQREAAAGEFIGVEICAQKLPPDAFRVVGLLPDEAHDVTASYDDGTTRRVAVEGNAYAFLAAKAGPIPETVAWRDATGQPHRTAVAPPGDVATSKCVR